MSFSYRKDFPLKLFTLPNPLTQKFWASGARKTVPLGFITSKSDSCFSKPNLSVILIDCTNNMSSWMFLVVSRRVLKWMSVGRGIKCKKNRSKWILGLTRKILGHGRKGQKDNDTKKSSHTFDQKKLYNRGCHSRLFSEWTKRMPVNWQKYHHYMCVYLCMKCICTQIECTEKSVFIVIGFWFYV